MSTINFAVSRKVNPEGEIPVTVEQLWKGLQLKARDARGFLPGVASCTVTEKKSENKFMRTIAFEGNSNPVPPLTEEITEHNATIIYFNADGVDRSVTNIVSYNENNELLLTFSFAGGLPKGAPLQADSSTPEKLNETVGKALEQTLRRTRELVKEGVI